MPVRRPSRAPKSAEPRGLCATAIVSTAHVAVGEGGDTTTRDETLCNLLHANVTLRLINRRAAHPCFYRDISRKLRTRRRARETARLQPESVHARVRDLPYIAHVRRGFRLNQKTHTQKITRSGRAHVRARGATP